MALVLDTGVLYAAMDRNDAAHHRCRALLDGAREPLVVPAPVLPEVDFWVAKHLGVGPMVALLKDIANGAFVVENLDRKDYVRVAEILDTYADVGFVDASVLAVAERLGEGKIATLDRRHFAMLRPRHVRAMRLVPD
jgi:hypothetical protein